MTTQYGDARADFLMSIQVIQGCLTMFLSKHVIFSKYSHAAPTVMKTPLFRP